MKLRQIWNLYNVSTLLVLPFYSDICKDTPLKINRSLSMPFIQLCMEFGLIQTYLEHDRFLVKFSKKVLLNNKLTDHTSFSLNEAFLASEYFQEVILKGEDFIFSLKLPEYFLNDFNKIRQSKYSELSDLYKDKLLITQNKIAVLENELASNIVTYNIPYSIAIKARHLKKDLEHLLKDDVPESNELYSKFSEKRETLCLQ